MEKLLGFTILSFFVTAICLVPFIDFLYKIKLQRKKQKTRDVFNRRTPLFDKMSDWKVGTPFGGGILVIAVVTFLTLFAYGILQVEVRLWEIATLLFAFIGFGALGFYDDLKKILGGKTAQFFGLRFKHKFIIQWILALAIGAILYMNGYDFVYIHWFGDVAIGALYILFAAFVIVSFVNAVNIADGLDGLSAGLFVICLIAFLAISENILDPSMGLFTSILLGSVAAFLYFNIYKARLWMGDVGALSFGAALAVIGLLTGKTIAIGLIGGVFVIEIASSLIQILSKKFLKKKAFPVAPFHLYLLKRGWEEPKIVMRAWLLGMVFAIIGLYLALI
ncbi:MAG: phospho-N-acetylmuramoyl-pentapeptide-transferase [Candidatus Levybacteria bacterium]|nr:phospho-N-acetylmuramoyl-pentapeptide-transferase [Candidatus Levybacteria bacterium]